MGQSHQKANLVSGASVCMSADPRKAGDGNISSNRVGVDWVAEEYEIYDLYEGNKGSRLPARRQQWVESNEEAATSSSSSASATAQAGAATASLEYSGSSLPYAGGGGDDDLTLNLGPSATVSPIASSGARGGGAIVSGSPWVVLTPDETSPVIVAASQLQQSGGGGARSDAKGAGKGTPPPPPSRGKVKGPGAPPPPGPKPKAAASVKQAHGPPPFGKRLHWKTLQAPAVKDTIFEELQPWGGSDVGGAPPLDTNHIERLFAPPVRNRAASSAGQDGGSVPNMMRRSGVGIPGSAGGVNALAGARNSSRGQVCLLDAKRAQNLAIVLRQVTEPTEELAEVLRWMRVSHPVSADTLEHVYENLLPALLESSELLNYEGPPEALRDVERQLLPLAKLPRLKARLGAMIFSKTMPKSHGEILSRIRTLKEACSQARGSTEFRKLISSVIRIGNYLNHGVDAPDAGGGVEVRGIAMESLLKLRGFRAPTAGDAASAPSALHAVALHMWHANPQFLANLKTEMCCCLGSPGEGRDQSETGTVGACIGALRDAVRNFQSEIDLVQGEIERFGDGYHVDGGPVEASGGPFAVLKRLTEDAQEMAHGLDAEFEGALDLACRLLEYFGENVARDGGEKSFAAVEKFFSTICEFITSFEECWRDVVKERKKLGLEGQPSKASSLDASVSSSTSPSLRAAAVPRGSGEDNVSSASRDAVSQSSASQDAVSMCHAGRDTVPMPSVGLGGPSRPAAFVIAAIGADPEVGPRFRLNTSIAEEAVARHTLRNKARLIEHAVAAAGPA